MQCPDLCALQAGARRAGCSPRPFAAPPAPLRPAARPARPGPHPPAWRGAAPGSRRGGRGGRCSQLRTAPPEPGEALPGTRCPSPQRELRGSQLRLFAAGVWRLFDAFLRLSRVVFMAF